MQKQKNQLELQYLLKYNSLGTDPWIKLTRLMNKQKQNILENKHRNRKKGNSQRF